LTIGIPGIFPVRIGPIIYKELNGVFKKVPPIMKEGFNIITSVLYSVSSNFSYSAINSLIIVSSLILLSMYPLTPLIGAKSFSS